MDYIRVGDPNPAKLKTIIMAACGDRTLNQFAGDLKLVDPNLKVSAPTISRACNVEEGGKPVSTDLLEAIAKLLPPESGYQLEDLIAANGMRTKEADSTIEQKVSADRRRQYAEEAERKVRMIFQNEIASRDFSFQQLSEFSNWRNLHGYRFQRDRVFPRNYTFGFSVSGMSPCSTWKFALDQMRLPGGGAESATEAHVGNFINKVGAVFASDSFEGDLYESEKYSFVFVDPDIYRLFLKRLNDHGLLVYGLFTAILVDLDAMQVVEETQLKRYDKAVAASFFKKPVVEDMDEIELTDPLDVVEEDDE